MIPLDFDILTLDRGAHDSRADGVCLLEAAAWLAGETHSDHPECVSPVLAAFGRSWNDALDDHERQRLKPFVPRLVGTAGDGHDEARAWMATDWLVRVQAPAWLRLAGLTVVADALERCAPVVSTEAARAVQPVLDEARSRAVRAWDAAGAAVWGDAGAAARDAAREAAWNAVEAAAGDAARETTLAAARDAAREAALATAWDIAWEAAGAAAQAAARNAAWNAAWKAARVATRAAAWEAAWNAAWDDAGAATQAAAGDAAWNRLQPTIEVLQASAFDLYDRMIALGEDQRTPATPAEAAP